MPTVVVFTSEHGEMGGDHAMLEKRSFYEEASRVPLLIRAPFVDGQPRTIGGNIGQVDLVPTLLELLEQPVPEDLREALEELEVMVRLLSIKDPFDGWRALTKEISKVWPEGVSAVDAIREQRDRPWNT